MFKVKKGFTVIEIAIVVAIVAILAGVWYVSKNKAGADIKMPGIGNGGATATGGKIIPPKVQMGTLTGLVTGIDGKPSADATSYTMVYFFQGTCNKKTGSGGIYYRDNTHSNGKYWISPVQPGTYCGSAMSVVEGSYKEVDDIKVKSNGTVTTVNFQLVKMPTIIPTKAP